MEYSYLSELNENVSCRSFTDVDPDVSGIEVTVDGVRIGSMIGVDLPDVDDTDEVMDFEGRVGDWIIENE